MKDIIDLKAPWEATKLGTKVISSATGETICELKPVHPRQLGGDYMPYKTTLAKAKLIAAAPELLEACKSALKTLEHAYAPVKGALKDAIIKATK